jgi:hypothetical protein
VAPDGKRIELKTELHNGVQAGAKFKENITTAIGNLRLMLEEQQTCLPAMDEPPLIASSERFQTER